MSAFNYEEEAPASSTWVVTHNLNNSALVVDVYVDVSGTLTKILPLDVVANSDNQLTVTFSTAQFGRVRVIG